jgi:hypothetical protein
MPSREARPEALHLAVQRFLAGVREGRMADVVGQRQGFGQVFVKRQDGGHCVGDLGHFDGVCQTVSEMVAEAGSEYLCLGL